MAKLEDLIRQISDTRLRDQIAEEVDNLKTGKKFGLVFEEHVPEQVQIPGLPVRPGVRVVKRKGKSSEVFQVLDVDGTTAHLVPESKGATQTASIDDLIAVKRFGEPIYPALTPRGRLMRTPEKPWHTIVNADNFHALQLLLYCYEGMVDVIYIDPPYNTGARDWKYNNDYIDRNDQYRHSKWLAMMKRRLLLAKRLLKTNGVLICTIDIYELNNLGVLLKDIFDSAGIHIVVIEHNKRGRTQANFAPTHEYAYYVIPDDKPVIANQSAPRDIRNINLRRTGNNSARANRPSMFYPIYVDPVEMKIVKIGDVPPDNFHPKQKSKLSDGLLEMWPLDDKNVEKCWYYGREGLLDLVEKEADKIKVLKTKDEIRVAFTSDNEGETTYKTVWSDSKYDASVYGSTMVKTIIGQEFPFPKSLYAVEECLSAVCRNRPNALILDFFAGSGTTLHATALMNAEDSGSRRCILVTNNEVSEKLGIELNSQGIFPGNPVFEQHGICESVTWPRTKYAIQGKREDGTNLLGTYLTGREMKDGFEENIEYFRLDFLDADEVSTGQHFEAILPILWLMAGALGERESNDGQQSWFIPKNSPFAVLLDETAFITFKHAIKERPDITHIFLVTDSEDAYYEMIAQLPDTSQTRMLYKSYLENFRININAGQNV